MTRQNNLVTDAIFNTSVNSIRVSDEYEYASRVDFSGSVFTAYVTGSLVKVNTDFTSKDSNRASYILGTRTRVFDITSPRSVPRVDDVYADEYFTPTYTYAGVNGIGFSVHICETEQLWDSCPPSMTSIAKIAGYPVYTLVDSSTLDAASQKRYVLFERNYWMVSSSTVPHARFFPFEPKYAAAIRRSTPDSKITTTEYINFDQNTTLRSRDILDNNVLYVERLVQSGSGTDEANPYGDIFAFSNATVYKTSPVTTGSIFPLSQTDAQKMHFGIGSGYGTQRGLVNVKTGIAAHIGDNNLPLFGGALEQRGSNTIFAYAPVIRGWKYGLANGIPTYTTAKWRRGRFGQFRDMLEQRQYTQFYDKTTGTATTSPVEVRFVDEDGNSVNPLTTCTSNCSYAATSSLPYFDLESKNRPPIDVSTLNTTNYVGLCQGNHDQSP